MGQIQSEIKNSNRGAELSGSGLLMEGVLTHALEGLELSWSAHQCK